MSFQTLNYPSHKLCYVKPYRTLHKTRSNRVLAMPPSTILWQTNESGSGSNRAWTSKISSNTVINLPNTVGIIGGLSENTTLRFLRKLVPSGSKDGSNIPYLLCSDPVLSKDLLLYEKSSLPALNRKRTELDTSLIVENLRSKRVFLENSGARCIVMPCHLSHAWYEEISEGSSVPFLHMGECIARQLKQANLSPIDAGSHLRFGVLATNATLTAGIYQEKLRNEGFEVVVPDIATMEHTVVPAIEAVERNDREGGRTLCRIALQVLLVRALNSIILASDDLRDLLPHNDHLLLKCVDPMDALALSTIKWAQAAGKGV
ncbi:hypothetical protein UlMin_017311 [Ulmus minor]